MVNRKIVNSKRMRFVVLPALGLSLLAGLAVPAAISPASPAGPSSPAVVADLGGSAIYIGRYLLKSLCVTRGVHYVLTQGYSTYKCYQVWVGQNNGSPVWDLYVWR